LSVVVVGVEQQQASLDLLEQVAVPDDMLAKVLADVKALPNVAEAVVLSTCLRTEVYAVVERFHEGVGELEDYLCSLAGEMAEAVGSHLAVLFDEEVVGHLFEVAAGLRSSVLGETEVLGQVRRALERAEEQRAAGPILQAMFRRAVQAGRRVRSSTSISKGTTSLAHAAIELASARLGRAQGGPGGPGGLGGSRVVVVGAGTIAQALVEALARVSPLPSVVVANRTPSRARALARSVGGEGMGLGALEHALRGADVIFVATGAKEPVLDADAVRAESRDGRRVVVVDLGVPRDVDPQVGSLPSVILLDMDDVTAHAGEARKKREAEAAAAQRIVDEEVRRYHDEVRSRGAAPVVAALRARVEELRRSEMARQRSKLPSEGGEEWAMIDELTRAVLAKVLHHPSLVLKETAGTQRGERLAEAVRSLFDL
jgi:glutamyl-tRNA reductase